MGSADLDALVPGLTWDVRTVAVHTGSVHRWAADVVRRRLPTNETGGSRVRPDVLDDADLAGWLTEGLDHLVATLQAAPDDLDCFTFVDAVAPRTFWCRRQAHETAVHRADVQAAGPAGVTPVDAAFAQDGLAELVGAFARGGLRGPPVGDAAPRADDGPAWRVRFGDGPNRVESGPASTSDADAVVSGPGSALYLWAWNRPAPVEVQGRADVVASWRPVRVS